MILIEKKWDKSLLDIKYGDGYDIRIHAVQVALCLLSRRSQLSNLKSINLSLVKFGYYDVETENAIGTYQYSVGIPKSNKIDKVTYESLFNTLRVELNAIIIQIAEDKLKIQEITSDMLDDEYDSNSDDKIQSSDSENELNSSGNNYNNFNDYYNDFISSEQLSQSGEEYGSLNNGYNNGINGGNLFGTSTGYENNNSFINGYNNEAYIDRFWGSMLEEYDSLFLSTTTNTKSFGSGGRLNLTGGRTYETTSIFTNSNNDTSNLGSSYIDTLLSNSIYSDNFDYVKPSTWISNSAMNINVSGYTYESSKKHDTFFSASNSDVTRKSNYDITIVYGANGQFAKKILGVVHRAKSQQVDSSGEAIFDIIEFIAKDIVETNN